MGKLKRRKRMAKVNDGAGRTASTVGQRATGQTVVGAANLLASDALLKAGMPPNILPIFTVAFQGIFTLVGKILRNVMREKGWLKYVG